jgi:hypothetical protein
MAQPGSRTSALASAARALHLPAVAVLLLRAAGAPSLNPVYTTPERAFCFALVVIAPQLASAAYDNLRCIAQVERRAAREAGGRVEQLAERVKGHRRLSLVVVLLQLAGMFASAAGRPVAGGAIATLCSTAFFYAVRRVRFDTRARVVSVHASFYGDVISAALGCAFLVIAAHLGVMPRVLGCLLVFIASTYWVVKAAFVPSQHQQEQRQQLL